MLLGRVMPWQQLLSRSRILGRSFSSTSPARADFTHVVIGAGVIGLATAQHLAARRSHDTTSTTLLIERHSQVGTETSSRNSEVIHAGLYYPPNSLKTHLCVRGRHQLYAFCERHAIPHRRLGKWIVAQDDTERDILERLHDKCRSHDVFLAESNGAPLTRWLSADEMASREPDVRAAASALESPETGIVDSHALMTALHGLFEDAGGVTALNSIVDAIEPLGGTAANGKSGWRVTVRDNTTNEQSIIETETLVNSAGLGAVDLHNMIVTPRNPDRKMTLRLAKGNYFSYAASRPRVRRLIYPVTRPGAGGLGTHLTLDLAGRMRFGPDVEWVDDAADLAPSAARLPLALREIRRYLPGVEEGALAPDYAGLRPKLGEPGVGDGDGDGFVDFWVGVEEGFEGWVSLLGMESPGLTSCLAVGEMVGDLLYGGGGRG